MLRGLGAGGLGCEGRGGCEGARLLHAAHELAQQCSRGVEGVKSPVSHPEQCDASDWRHAAVRSVKGHIIRSALSARLRAAERAAARRVT